MEGILLDTMFDLPSLDGVEEVVISGEVVEGTARPLYIYADRAGRRWRHGQLARWPATAVLGTAGSQCMPTRPKGRARCHICLNLQAYLTPRVAVST